MLQTLCLVTTVSNNGAGHLPVPMRAFTEVPAIEDNNIASRYSRLVKGSREYVFKELNRELSELEGQRDEELRSIPGSGTCQIPQPSDQPGEKVKV